MNLREFFDVDFSTVKLAMAAGQTIYQYKLNLGRFNAFLESELQKLPREEQAAERARRGLQPGETVVAELADLTDAKIGQACLWLMNCNRKKLSIASASKLRENLVSLWKFAFARGLLRTLPVIPHIREPRRIPRAWTREQLGQLWEYLTRLPGEIGEVPENVWYPALVATLWDTGERIGALWQVIWQDVDLVAASGGGWMIVRAHYRKFHKSDRLYKLDKGTVGILNMLREKSRGAANDRLFHWPYSETYLWQRWQRILKRAGLPTGREYAFHCIRKSVGSHLKLLGADARSALDHESDATTNSRYIDPRIVQATAPADVLFRLGDVG